MIITDHLACSNPDCDASLPVEEYLADLTGHNGFPALEDAIRVRDGKGCPECHFGFGLDVDLSEARLRADRDLPDFPYREKNPSWRESVAGQLHTDLTKRANRALYQTVVR